MTLTAAEALCWVERLCRVEEDEAHYRWPHSEESQREAYEAYERGLAVRERLEALVASEDEREAVWQSARAKWDGRL